MSKKIKPDGWIIVNKDNDTSGCVFYRSLQIAEEDLLEGGDVTNWQIRPVCLASPQLLEWVEKVERSLNRRLDCTVMSHSKERLDLLAELEEIRKK